MVFETSTCFLNFMKEEDEAMKKNAMKEEELLAPKDLAQEYGLVSGKGNGVISNSVSLCSESVSKSTVATEAILGNPNSNSVSTEATNSVSTELVVWNNTLSTSTSEYGTDTDSRRSSVGTDLSGRA